MKIYGSVSLSGDRTQWIVTRAEPHVSIRMKQLFPSIPKAAVPPYRLPHNLVTDTDLGWFMERYPLDISPADKRSLAQGRKSFLQRQAEMERILMPDYVPGGSAALREGQELRLYQWQAIEVLRRRGSLL
ncbi:MAG TPA: hypothetical protein VFE25_11950, partial [Opitutaceae bacterium]|nr:hypothetical protein [Opitutaceae bacterium]